MLIDWFTVAAQAVNFLILVWILHRFVFRPILKAADEREERSAFRLAKADRAREQAEEERKETLRRRLEIEKARDEALARADTEARRRLDKALTKVDAHAEVRRKQWERTLSRRSEELTKDIRALVGRQVVGIARRAVLDMAGQSLEDRLADSLTRHLDDVREALCPEACARIEVRAPQALSAEAAERLRLAMGREFPGSNIQLAPGETDLNGNGPGLVLACGDRRLEWTMERYFKGLEEDIQAVLATYRSRQGSEQ